MKNRYSFSEKISTCYSLFVTKLFYKHARLIRRPFYIRGKKSFKWGRGLTTGHSCRFDLPGSKNNTLIVGDNCQFGDMTHIVAHQSVTIGNNVLIASKVFISDVSHGSYSGSSQDNPLIPPVERKLVTKPVHIGNNVWIGENAVILPGVSIGDGCIVGANSTVTKSFEGNCIIAGSPAKLIKIWDKDKNEWIRVA